MSTPVALEFFVDHGQSGQTLAAVVRGALDGLPWTQARELCRYGKVRVNAVIEKDATRRVLKGDAVAIDPSAPRRSRHVLDDDAVLYVDRQVVVVNKPADLLSVPFNEGDKNTLIDRLRFWLRRKDGAHGAELGAVQRLDKDTTGLLVFARTLPAKRVLQEQFRKHTIERRYQALVHGVLGVERRIETHIVPNRGDGLRGSWERSRHKSEPVPAIAQRAITHLRPLQALRGATLLECQLETGRQHQIRIHLSELGHTLIGEQVYVREHSGKVIAATRPMLHAAVLGFEHPHTGKPMRFDRPPPSDFADKLSELAGA